MHDIFTMVQTIDVAWLGALHSITSPALDWLAWLISVVSWAGACWWLLAAFFWLRGQRVLAVQLVIALLLAAVGGGALKHMVHRVRPDELMPQYVHLVLPNLPDTRWAFPSGHTLMAAAAAMTCLFATHRRWAWGLVAASLIIGWARIYQGVHWPSDVLAGLFLGIVCAAVAVIVSENLRRTSRKSTAPHF